MITLLHTADWQLGARFAQFGPEAARMLRAARQATLRKALDAARAHRVDAFLIAGDLFENNLVDEAEVAAALRAFADFPEIPIYIVPGNHDPYTGPDCVWERPSVKSAPAHVRVLRRAEPVDLGAAWLLPSPLTQKVSRTDPSQVLGRLAGELPDATAPAKIRVGLTHGSLAIEGLHKEDDFPIAPDAATRAGLDYLAIGHWHSWFEADGGRVLMPGTPERDAFDTRDCGHAALVRIDAPGALPRLERLPLGTLAWREIVLDLAEAEASRPLTERLLDESTPETILRLSLRGSAPSALLEETRQFLSRRLTAFPIHLLDDRATLEMSELECRALVESQPVLAQVLADLEQIEALLAQTPATGAWGVPSPFDSARTAALLKDLKINEQALDAGVFAAARKLILEGSAR